MGMVDYIVKKMKLELAAHTRSEKPVRVIATGGIANMIDSGTECFDIVDKQLTLEGLQFIYEKNKHSRADGRNARLVNNEENML
jgi:type III pantothenate kinase